MGLITGTSAIVLIILSLADTILTYEWAKLCIRLNPKLKMNQVESNKFICVCWNNYGLVKGSIISGGILLAVQILLSSIHRYVFYTIAGILVFAIYNHLNNLYLVKNGKVAALNKKKGGKK